MFEKIKNILIEDLQVPEDDITMNSELISDLGINSLELADLILMCEEKFNIEIKDEDIHKFISVGDVVNYLSEMCDE
ncbi:MAG: acyl carrier protein [Eubacteriales bacterium]